MDAAKRDKLAAVGILVVEAELEKHYIVERSGFLALIERETWKPGTAGLLTERGLAPLMWNGDRASFVARGFDQPASDEQIAALRSFQRDLESALG